MSCDDIRENLLAYLYEALEDEEHREVRPSNSAGMLDLGARHGEYSSIQRRDGLGRRRRPRGTARRGKKPILR